MSYRKMFVTIAELEEYTVVSLAKCVVSSILKQYDGTHKRYSLKDLRDLIKKAGWYVGILDDCKNLGLDADKILGNMRHYLNENSIFDPLPVFYGTKLHWIEVQTFGSKPFVSHRAVIIPPDEVATLKKEGVL